MWRATIIHTFRHLPEMPLEERHYEIDDSDYLAVADAVSDLIRNAPMGPSGTVVDGYTESLIVNIRPIA
jgi:hypothetical protein